jgi:sugar phosphate isomerase/epimerase
MSQFSEKMSRRDLLAGAGLAAGATLAGTMNAASPTSPSSSKQGNFVYSLNTSTIRGQHLGIEGELKVAAQAGYHAVEPWLSSIGDYVKAGKSLKDLGKMISDLGLFLGSSIAFPEWVVDDDAKRAAGLEQAKRDMDAVAQIGGTRIAAPPAGAKEVEIDLRKVTERYHALLELGDKMGITPELEFWGPSKTLHDLGQAMYVAMETGHPKACILADVYHMYKGGTSMETLRLAGGPAIVTLHMNDYPADPPREKIDDSFRVFPGDGIAPIPQILRTLRDSGANTLLSLELFNRDYWRQDSLKVAQMGLEKMKAQVEKALA